MANFIDGSKKKNATVPAAEVSAQTEIHNSLFLWKSCCLECPVKHACVHLNK